MRENNSTQFEPFTKCKKCDEVVVKHRIRDENGRDTGETEFRCMTHGNNIE